MVICDRCKLPITAGMTKWVDCCSGKLRYAHINDGWCAVELKKEVCRLKKELEQYAKNK